VSTAALAEAFGDRAGIDIGRLERAVAVVRPHLGGKRREE
jgi:hypothetical protein